MSCKANSRALTSDLGIDQKHEYAHWKGRFLAGSSHSLNVEDKKVLASKTLYLKMLDDEYLMCAIKDFWWNNRPVTYYGSQTALLCKNGCGIGHNYYCKSSLFNLAIVMKTPNII